MYCLTRVRWLAIPWVLAMLACSINPATGKRQLSLISGQQEIALGREADPQIVAQFGLYPDEALQAYVQELGDLLAARSERPELPWTFRVVDDPVVNAFALPGGFIYVTRGILAHLGSEAELVGVLGHEIGHVTARHGASQMSKAMLAQAGLGLGAVLASEDAASLGTLAQAGVQLLFLKYGRDDERQADDLGLRYSLRAGYDPRSMVEVFDLLGRVSEQAGGERAPGWLSTHPAPENRSERLAAEIARSGLAADRGLVRRDDYLQRLQGMTFGEDPRQGFFRDGFFYHPELAFQFQFPAEWRALNSRQAVVVTSPNNELAFQITVASETTAAEALRAFFSPSSVLRGSPGPPRIGEVDAASAGFEVRDREGAPQLRGLVAFLEWRGTVLRLLVYGRLDPWSRGAPRGREILGSFQPLRDPSILGVQPMRIELVRPSERRSMAELDSSVSAETLELINHLDPGAEVAPGTLVKNVVGFNPEA